MANLRSNASFIFMFFGRLISNVGDSVYIIAAMWLVYDLTGSAFYTGVAGFLLHAPSVFQFACGPLVDRWPVRKVLVASQLVQGVFVLVVPLAAATGTLTVWVLLVVIPLLATFNQFVYPAQNASLPRIVEEDDLVRANSLFTMAYQASDSIFNAVSGVLIGVVGAMTLFAFDSATFAVAAVLFYATTIPPAEDDADDRDGAADRDANDPDATARQASVRERVRRSKYAADMLEGIRYIRGSVVLSLILGVMITNAAFGATLAVLPSFADSLGGAEAYGYLMAAYAGGLFVGTVGSNVVEDRPYGLVCVGGFLASSVALGAALVVPSTPLTVALFFVTFVPIGAFNVLFWTMLQSTVDDGLLGRVTSIASSLGSALLSFGSLAGGSLGGVVGVRFVIASLAVSLGFLAGYFLLNSSLRTLPPIAEATKSSLELGSADAGG